MNLATEIGNLRIGQIVELYGDILESEWEDIPWKKLEQSIFNLQQRIFRAEVNKDYRKVRSLQRTLLNKDSALLYNMMTDNFVNYRVKIMLEPYVLKGTRTVLRRERKSNLSDLSDIQVSMFFPSSKMCNICKEKYEELKLDMRTWTCPHCNTTHDRDINAAKNILYEGLRILAGELLDEFATA